jgi:hypothetical protein
LNIASLFSNNKFFLVLAACGFVFFFEMALGLDVQESSFLTLIPYVAMIAMTPVVSAVGDRSIHVLHHQILYLFETHTFCTCMSVSCEMALGQDVQESSFLTLIPYVAMIAMTPVVS